MKITPHESLEPRKKPRQGRSAVTMDVICEAAIQVLLNEDFEKTSTTKIAERAGVSVGTLYQYFPNKRALLSAVVHRHITEVVDATIAACRSVHGSTIEEMSARTIAAFVEAKTRRPDVSRALYLPSALIGGDAIVKAQSARSASAVEEMLRTARNARFSAPDVVSRVMVASVVGPTQAAIEAGGPPALFDALKVHLTALCLGYLREMNTGALG